jgi:asparagine synthase (glutamine-hydrolysing)
MCGIWAYIGSGITDDVMATCMRALAGRGPEMGRTERVVMGDAEVTLGFTRLAINGLNEAGMQPFHWVAEDGTRYTWICNGEIYNWRQLAKDYGISVTSGSDCEVLGPLFHIWNEAPDMFFDQLDGVFSVVIVNETA